MSKSSQSSQQSVVVMGMGVVGLPVALLLADVGYKVLGVDISKGIINLLNQKKLPPHIQEEELQSLLRKPGVTKNFHVQLAPQIANIFLIAVPTPLNKSKKTADLSYVEKAIKTIAPFLKKGDLVIVESTVPPLTCRNLLTPIIEKEGFKVGENIFLAHCPERILPGNIYKEIVNNDRIIGGINEKTCDMAAKVYRSFVKGNIYKTDDVSAELCKLMENAYRDVNIALANEFAQVAQNLGVDPKNVIALANKHPRVNILKPGIGVGGHCIPIDPWFIHEVDPNNSKLIATSRMINNDVPHKIADIIKKKLMGIRNPKIVAVGASYKTDSTDTRESPAIEVVKILRNMDVNVAHLDPLVKDYKYPKSLSDECLGKDLLVILVPHQIVLVELNKNREKIQASLSTHQILQF